MQRAAVGTVRLVSVPWQTAAAAGLRETSGGLVSESVTATFVFTDLVDSTATAARLGPAAAEELRQTHFKLLRGAVTASGGTEVKNLGDGLMVMYSSPSRALAGVVGMQQAIERHNRSADQVLAVRIGISAGEAAEEDDDFFGDPVIEAARLCARAEGGQILAADVVRSLVGRHATQTFVDVGPLALKGIPEPVDAVEVLWEPVVVVGSVPLPDRLVGAASAALFGFFGRTRESAALQDAQKQAQATQRCQVVFVAGEAGMGKTSLAAQVARNAHANGTVVLFGHAAEDAGISYQPWIEVVCTLVRDGDPEWLANLRPAQRTALARLAPEIGAETNRVADPDTERLLLWEGTSELLALASRSAPVMIVLDDLHWADTASLQLLRHIVASATPMNMTIVGTYRDTDLTRGDALSNLLADLHREANVSRITLDGLDDNELVELLAAAAGHDLDEDGVGLAHALRRETDGNPFFTAEMLRHLGETGGVVIGDDGRWMVSGQLGSIGLPNSVRDVVGRRVERLGEETLRVLCLAAVIGRDFDLSVLAQLADIDDDPLLDLMDAAVAAALLVETGTADRYRFAHALIQHSLYDELSATRRQRAHQRIAENLEGRAFADDAATLAELAHHWVAATRPADLEKALEYVTRAGDAACDALAPDDAIRWYQQALDLLARENRPDKSRRAQLLADLGAAQRQAAQPEYRSTLLEAATLAQELDDTEILVRAVLGFGQGTAQVVGDDDAKSLIVAAIERIGTDPSPRRARLLAALAETYDASLEWQTRRDVSLEAVDIAERAGDDATYVEVIDATFYSLAAPDRRDQLIRDIARAVGLADRIADPVLQARIRMQMVWARYQLADLDGAGAVIGEFESLAEKVGLPVVQTSLDSLRTGQLLLSGNTAEAEVVNERALELGMTAGSPAAMAAFGALLSRIRQQQGRTGEMLDFFIDVARDNPSIAALRSGLIFMLSEVGRVNEARERMAVELATGFDFPRDTTWMSSMANLLDGAAATRDERAAQTLLQLVAPFADQVIVPMAASVEGAIARPLARAATVSGDYDQAEEWFSVAHEVHAQLRSPFWIALGQLDHADLCLARGANGDLDRARDLIDAAAATAAEFGCAGLTKRATGLLADLDRV